MRKNYILLLLLIFTTVFASAQKMSIGFIYPAGGERGTSVDLEIGGLNLSSATGVLISGDGVKTTLIPLPSKDMKGRNRKQKLDDQSSPQLADRIGVRVKIDPNAIPGLRDLRLQSLNGVSNKLSFEVGQYPNVPEKNKSTEQNPTPVTKLPATLCGQIMPGEIDYFRFEATKGLNLIASVKARILVPYMADAVPGWFQSVIRITNSKGKEIAYCDDYRNAVDPVIRCKIPETDTYTLAIHDAIFRGREDFNYRIEIGEIPFIEYAFPCVGKINENAKVTVKGFNLSQKIIQYKPSQEGLNELTASSKNGYLSNPIPFWGVSKNTGFELDPSEKPEILPNSVLYDSLTSPRQIKTYTIPASKNENIAIEIKARRLSSLLDARIKFRDPSGKLLLEVDDVEDAMQGLMTHHADPIVQYQALVAGNYLLEVEDVLGNFGADCFYIIERKKNLPTFEVFVSPANLTIPQGGTALLRLDIVTSERIPELDVTLQGLPKGFLVSSLHTQTGSKTWEISVTAPSSAKEEKLSLTILTQAKIKGKIQSDVSQTAVAADNMMQAFYYTHHIPAAGFVAEIIPASPFSLRLSSEMENNMEDPIVFAASDSILPIKVKIIRKAGFKEPVDLVLSRKLKQITMDPVQFLPNETEKTLLLKLDSKMLKNQRRIRLGFCIVGTVNGKVEKKGKRIFQNALYREISPMFMLEKKP